MKCASDNYGERIIDKENDGTPEHLIQLGISCYCCCKIVR
jgi:hypothetical protein